MKNIVLIGGGFSGTMTAVQLIHKLDTPCEITLINERATLNKGIAYKPYSEKHILNVSVAKMSAYPDKPDDFLDWVMSKNDFKKKDRTLIAGSFLSRQIYGEYLSDIWNHTLEIAASKQIKISPIESIVIDLEISENTVSVLLENKVNLSADYCVIATGNHAPRNPTIKNKNFYPNKNYFQNPWKIESVQHVNNDLPVLIVGNGLTMVDTIFGLVEQGFKGEIHSISSNGFNILPHQHTGSKYSKLTEELSENLSLLDLLSLVNKHIKIARKAGVSAEPIIDSLRPYTQQIWKSLSEREKEVFMSRLRHLWGVARHRIPFQSYEQIQKLRTEGKLHITSGKILDFNETATTISVDYFDKKERTTKKLNVSRIINCTGPETDLLYLDNGFLKKCVLKGMLTQDQLKLGVSTNTETFQVFDSKGKEHFHLFTLGSNLKGELWESTAVNELRAQAERLAQKLAVFV